MARGLGQKAQRGYLQRCTQAEEEEEEVEGMQPAHCEMAEEAVGAVLSRLKYSLLARLGHQSQLL